MSDYALKVDKMIDQSVLQKITQTQNIISRKAQWRVFQIILLLSDIVTAGAAFRLAYWVRFEAALPFFQEDAISAISYYQILTVVMVPLWIILYVSLGLYNPKKLLGGTEEYASIFRASVFGLLLVIFAGFLEPTLFIARGWLLMAWGLSFLFPTIGRFTVRRIAYYLRRYGYLLTPAVIIGSNEEGRWLAEQLSQWRTSGLLLLGFIDDLYPAGKLVTGNLHVLGPVTEMDKIIQEYDIGELVLASSAISSRNKQMEIFKKYGISSEITFRMSSGLYEIITTGLTVSELAYVPFVTINKARLTGFDKILKLVLDYAITIPGLLLLFPFFILLGIAIKLDSPGPIFHRRRVVGINGVPFDAFKFRTMHISGDEILEAHPELKARLEQDHKLKDDPRITRIGKYLRKFSIDEFPQLANVLRREMSLVGPRMITLPEVEKYHQWDINLLTVRPGITGLWQVSGRSDVSYEERVQLDMYYIRNWTIWMDIQILIQTIPAVLKSRGAY